MVDPAAALTFVYSLLEEADALTAQRPGWGVRMDGVVSDAPRTFVMKKVGHGATDWRCFCADTGVLLWSENQGLVDRYCGRTAAQHPQKDQCQVTKWARGRPAPSFTVKHRWRSLHLRHEVLVGSKIAFSVAKRSRGSGVEFSALDDSDNEVLRVTADVDGRRYWFKNMDGELVGVAKVPKTTLLLHEAVAGCELQLVVAPGVDCSFLVAVLFGLKQCSLQYSSQTQHPPRTPPTDSLPCNSDTASDFMTEHGRALLFSSLLSNPTSPLTTSEQFFSLLGGDFDLLGTSSILTPLEKRDLVFVT